MDWFMRSKEEKIDWLQWDKGGVRPRNGCTDNGLRLAEPEGHYNNYRGKYTVFMVRL